jgi:anti-sigma factor RsiW
MLDEPDAFTATQREHVQQCNSCNAELASLDKHAQFARRALSGDVAVDAARAYDRVRLLATQQSPVQRLYRPAAAFAAAAVLVLALIFTPLGTYARSFLTIFEPKTFVPIEISRADMRSLHLLPQADDVGIQRVVSKPQKRAYDSIAQVQQHAGFALLKPATLPPGFGTVRSFFGYTPGEMTFTFSAAKARAFVRRSHKALPPMPPELDGTTVRLHTGFGFDAHYESTAKAKSGRDTRFLEIVQMQAPRVTSTGASLDTLERYLLSLPNVTPELAKQIRALGDIQNTVPVPIVINKQSAQHVTVDGVQGLAIGDNTGLGSGVMWQKNGIIYVVAGPLSMDEVMTVANGLR